jgi:hypothetical protein
LVSESTITITYSGDTNIQGEKLVLKASNSGGSIAWDCKAAVSSGTRVDDKYLPSNCR